MDGDENQKNLYEEILKSKDSLNDLLLQAKEIDLQVSLGIGKLSENNDYIGTVSTTTPSLTQ